jgi:riboflavin-specific deaminase-like protein
MSIITQNLPELAVNFALTWDGRVATRDRGRADFSSPRDKGRMLELRAGADAVLVGRGTLEIEEMQMGISEPLRAQRIAEGKTASPLRVIVSGSGKIDPGARIFQTGGSPILIFTTAAMPPETRAALVSKAEVDLKPGAHVDLRAMLAKLYQYRGVRRLLCEGGPTLLRALLEENLVDEINLTFCPRIFGGSEAPTLTGGPGAFLPAAIECRLEATEQLGDECFARYRVLKPCAVSSPI